MRYVPGEVTGIHQSDIIVRSAIIQGINTLRANPWLLDYAFASLAADPVTADEYGETERDKAKEWFTHTAISVRMDTNPNEAKLPCVAIGLLSSNEVDAEGSLADVHYQPQEPNSWQWPTLVGPLDAIAWTPASGQLTLDPVALGTFVLAPGMIVVTSNGAQYPIVNVLDTNVVSIQPNVPDQLAGQGVTIKPAPPAYVTSVESAVFRETYSLACVVDSEEVHLTYLHSLVVFCLLMYREVLLEARGFERCSVSSGDFKRDPRFLPENVFVRAVTITGTVRQAWPKTIALAGTGVDLEVVASQTGDVSDLVVVPIFGQVAQAEQTPNAPPPAPIPAGTVTYYGVAAQPGSINVGFLQGLSGRGAQTTRQATLTFNGAGATSYCWYAYPLGWGGTAQDFVDAETAIEAGWSLVATVLIGSTVYGVWRSNQPDLGNGLTVIVT